MDNTKKNMVALGFVLLMAEYTFVICDGMLFTKYNYNGNIGHKHAPNVKVVEDEAKDPFTCGKLCHAEDSCKSFSYQPGTGMCIGCSTLHCGAEHTDSSEDSSSKTTFYSTMKEPYGPDPAVRLSGGNHSYEGRLEVQYNGELGTVCNDSFDTEEAKVVCKMLKVTTAYAKVSPGVHVGQRTLPILLSDVSCSGSEANLLECPHRAWGDSACRHGGDVGISCVPELHIRLAEESTPDEGRIEVSLDGIQWGTVCGNMNENAASLACKMLGYQPIYGGTDTSSKSVTGPIFLANVECTGNEMSLLMCSSLGWNVTDCGHDADVTVKCIRNNMNGS